MRLSKKLIQQIIDALPVHLYWANKEAKIEGANILQAINFGDKDVKSCIGKNAHDFSEQLNWDKKFTTQIQQEHIDVIRTGKGSTHEYSGILANGEEHTFLSYKYPLVIHNKVVGLTGISVDITDRKKMEETLKQSKIEAEQASIIKTEFIRNMEHDLRTPTSGIASFAALLASAEVDENKKEKLSLIAGAGKRLLNVLNGILEFNNVNTKKSPVVEKPINIRELVLGIAELERPTADVKQLELKTTISKDVPKYLLGDEFRLNRILINLISNAIKYTHSGFVHTKIEIAKQTEELPQKKSNSLLLEIMVEDSGIGIPKNKLDFIYEKFYRVHESNQGIYSGSGLGLYLVKNFIDDLEGQIVVYSELDRGTKVRCSIPVKKSLLEPLSSEEKLSAKKRISNQYAVPQQQLKILLVADDIIAQTVALFFLRNRFNCDVSAVFDGNTAVSLTDSQNYVLIFLDLGLPDKNGIDVAKEIRLKPDYANTPIIALTAHNEQYTRKKGANIINDFLSKPITPEKIQEVFDRWIPQPDQNKL